MTIDRLLLESGSVLLLEDGSALLLESSTSGTSEQGQANIVATSTAGATALATVPVASAVAATSTVSATALATTPASDTIATTSTVSATALATVPIAAAVAGHSAVNAAGALLGATSGLTDAMENDVLRWLTGQATTILSTTPLAHVYLSLHVTTPSDSAAGTEVSGPGYARTDAKGKFGVPSVGSVANTAEIDWPTATGSWGTLAGIGVYDALTGGNRIAWADIPGGPTIGTDQTVLIDVGNLVFSFA